MQHKLKATFCCFMASCALYAQNGNNWQLPAVNFPMHANFCDNNPWKLVLFDDFNGNQLNTAIWNTYYSWNGMPGGDNDNSDGARKTGGLSGVGGTWNTVALDRNVIVSNGTCKLLVKNEPYNWHCPTCPDTNTTRYYTAGMLATPYHLRPDQHNNFFNSGKFEVRLKMPRFEHAHTTLWTWHGSDWDATVHSGINEIDMVEAYGENTSQDPNNPNGIVNTYNLHAWGPDPDDPTLSNPNDLPHNAVIENAYPNQSWYNLRHGTYNNIADWHTYTCEWDTASLKILQDGNLINTFWKYYTKVAYRGPRGSRSQQIYFVNVGSGCIGSRAGNYYITYGYPYNSTHSESNFRITVVKDGSQWESVPVSTSTLLGQAEIDYVKIWQKHPAQDGHTEICADNTYPTPNISGSVEVCPISSFTLSPAIVGTWSVSNEDKLYISNASSSGVTLSKQAGESFNGEHLTFSYGNGIPGCPTKSVQVNGLFCNESTDWQIMQPTILDNNGNGRFQFISELYYKRDVTGGTTPIVEWDIAVNPGQDYYDEATAVTYNLKGQYASSPSFKVTDNQSYNLRWTMNVTDASGTWSRSGERNSKTALYQQGNDKNTYYVNAYIDDAEQYETTVYNGVVNQMVSEEEIVDSLYMDELIEKVRAIALEPYLIDDGMETFMGKNGSNPDKPGEEGGNRGTSAMKSKLKVYPNPIRSNITIIADARFIDKQAITIHVYDLAGKLIKTGMVNYNKGNIMTYDLSDIADGNYILELQQGHLNEHIKIIKAKN